MMTPTLTTAAVGALLLIPQLPIPDRDLAPPKGDQYDPRLAGIDTLARLDAAVRVRQPAAATNETLYAQTAAELIEQRFYHGFSRFSWSENWLLVGLDRVRVTLAPLVGIVLVGKPEFNRYSSPVRADDILKHPSAGCSQQALVFQALMRARGIPYATVRFLGTNPHMASVARPGGVWRYYDTNLEARHQGERMQALLARPAAFQQLYQGSWASWIGPSFDEAASHGKLTIADRNIDPAAAGAFLQQGTGAAARFAWLPVLGLAFALRRRSTRPSRSLPSPS